MKSNKRVDVGGTRVGKLEIDSFVGSRVGGLVTCRTTVEVEGIPSGQEYATFNWGVSLGEQTLQPVPRKLLIAQLSPVQPRQMGILSWSRRSKIILMIFFDLYNLLLHLFRVSQQHKRKNPHPQPPQAPSPTSLTAHNPPYANKTPPTPSPHPSQPSATPPQSH